MRLRHDGPSESDDLFRVRDGSPCRPEPPVNQDPGIDKLIDEVRAASTLQLGIFSGKVWLKGPLCLVTQKVQLDLR